MTEVFRFTVLGLGAGGLYALAAIGMVLVHRGSGVVNFAQAAMGMIGAYAYYEFKVVRSAPTPVALVIGLSVSAATGALFHLLVMRRMGQASMLARVVATLALLVTLQGTSALIYGPLPRVVPSMLPTGPVRVFGASVGADRLWILGIVTTLTVALWALYRSTTFGIATSAVAENPRAAAALAVSPDAIATANWAIGSALGALAVILLVPITGLGSDNITLLVIPVLAAAVIGRMTSFPATMVGGLAIGVAQSLVTRYVSTPGWPTAVPFVLVATVLLARGRRVTGKDERFGRMPSLGDGRLAPGAIVGSSVAALAAIWWWLPSAWVDAITVQLLLATVLLSFVVVTGYAGQLSLAQLSFCSVGTLGCSWLMFHHGWSFGWALLGAMVLTMPIGVIVGLAGLRTRSMNFAIVTLGFAIAFGAVVLGNRNLMRRVLGRRGTHLRLMGIDVAAPAHQQRYATVALITLVIVSITVANLRRGRAGRRLIAIRTNERAAAALGVSVLGAKLYAFVLGGAIAGLGGALLAFRTPFMSQGGFGSFSSIQSMQYAVFGGVGTVAGPLVGSGFNADSLGPRFFSFLGDNAATKLSVGLNLAILVMLAVAPDGIVPLVGRARRRAFAPLGMPSRARRHGSTRGRDRSDLAASSSVRVVPTTLQVDHLTVRFGGTVALDDATFSVHPGEVVGLIGPNGAGKSTAIEAITGFVNPASGHVRLGERAIDRWGRERRARRGLSRSFQSLELFEDLTVTENILAACDRRDPWAYATDLVWPGRGRLTPVAALAIREFGLAAMLEVKVRELSYADRRMLAVARAVAGGQPVLLLDEPAAGLDAQQTDRLGEAVRRLAEQRGVAVLLVEHNVDMVLRTCDRVYALDFGRVIGEGTPEQIRANPAVVDAYLGAAPTRPDPAPQPT